MFFDEPDDDDGVIAVDEAMTLNVNGLEVTRKPRDSIKCTKPAHRRDRMEFKPCEFKRYEPHFNSNFAAINYEDLVKIKSLTHNTIVVSFKGEQFVHKFMNSKCHQITFEYEVDNYLNLVGVSGVPVLRLQPLQQLASRQRFHRSILCCLNKLCDCSER